MAIRRTLGTLALAAAATLFTGCDELTGSEGDATIIVENNASVSVFFLYIAECSDDDWGDDELGANETIAPGAEREFGVDAGCWDLRAEFSDDTFAEDYGVELDEGEEFTWELID